MIRRLLLSLGLLLMTCGPTAAEDSHNLMTFNIRYDNRGDGLNAWQHRSSQVAAMFAHHDVAIAGLQEVLHRQLVELKRRLPAYEVVGVGRNDGKQAGEYAPILFRRDQFELGRQQTIWLSESPAKVGSKSWDSSLPRIATLAWLTERQTGKCLLVVNTHFDHRGVIARRESAALIGRHIKSVNSDKRPVIVMGDLNCLPKSDPYKALQQAGLDDAMLHTKQAHKGPQSTWNGFGKAVHKGRRIDFIFVSPNVHVHSHEIDARMFKGRFPSDHCPVIASLMIPKSD